MVSLVQNQRLSSFASKLCMTGHQRYFVNKFQKYNLANDLDVMDQIKHSEEKEARRIKPGWSKESYEGIWTRARNFDVTESVDRRLLFELMGTKLNPDGTLKLEEKVSRKVAPIADDEKEECELRQDSIALLRTYERGRSGNLNPDEDTSNSDDT